MHSGIIYVCIESFAPEWFYANSIFMVLETNLRYGCLRVLSVNRKPQLETKSLQWLCVSDVEQFVYRLCHMNIYVYK